MNLIEKSMAHKLLRRGSNACRRGCIRLFVDTRAIAATEFAVLLPFLLFLYIGATQLTMAIMINRQVALTASTVANIVAQYTSISASSQFPDIFNASAQIFSPNSTAPAKIVVSLLTIDANGKATVGWSQTFQGKAYKAGDTVTVPAALDVPNTTLVFSEVTYAYTPPFGFVPMGTINLYAPIYMPPRDSSTINLVS
jgi:Flp pilus assembly protein TadG